VKSKGTLVALVAIIAGMCALLVAGFILRDQILEQWYVYQLHRGDPGERQAAAIKLAEMGSPGAIPYLLRSEGSKATHSHTEEWKMLLNIIHSRPRESVEELKGMLEDENREVRRIAAVLLGGLGPVAAGAVPLLVDRLKDPDHSVRHVSTLALSRIGSAGGEAVAPLVNALEDPDPLVRIYAAEVLGKIGPPARMAVSRLRQLVEKTDSLLLRHTAEEALKKILGEESGERSVP